MRNALVELKADHMRVTLASWNGMIDGSNAGENHTDTAKISVYW